MRYNDWALPGRGEERSAMGLRGISPLLSELLASRGIVTERDANDFLDCGEEQVLEAGSLEGIDKGAARVRTAIENGEKIAVYGDYDVDGITAVCLMTDYLRSRGVDAAFYIPGRFDEGYGVNSAAIRALADTGVTLIITVDCGITAAREVEEAAGMGVDMVITDHHECPEDLPDAAAVINPKLPGSRYMGGELAGVGVAFKLVCAVDGDTGRILERYCDLIAVGTIADVVPLKGENRALARLGLKKLAESPNLGLASLMKAAGVSGKTQESSTVGFTIAPRLNAAGRMGNASLAAELLLCKSRVQADAIARELCDLNCERRKIEAVIWDEAVSELSGAERGSPVILAREGWHQGVIGIVASRLCERYIAPAIMISLEDGKGRGSCRSPVGFSLWDALSECAEYLDNFGGHSTAAGISIRFENIESFKRAFSEYFRKNPPEITPRLEIDAVITSPELISYRCVDDLSRLEPFGAGNPRPVVCILNAYVESTVPLSEGKHTRLYVKAFDERYDCVFFGVSEGALGVRAGEYADIAFFPKISRFRGRSHVQLQVTDIRRAAGARE